MYDCMKAESLSNIGFLIDFRQTKHINIVITNMVSVAVTRVSRRSMKSSSVLMVNLAFIFSIRERGSDGILGSDMPRPMKVRPLGRISGSAAILPSLIAYFSSLSLLAIILYNCCKYSSSV